MYAFSLRRLMGPLVRYAQQLRGDIWHLISMFYWPLIDLVVIGYLGTAQIAGARHELEALLIGVILWSLTVHTYFSIVWNMLEEIWSGNIAGLFATPILMREWVIALVIYATIHLCILTLFLSCLSRLLYGFWFITSGVIIFPALFNVLLFSVSLGFFLVALLFMFGQRVQSLVFMIGYLFGPIVGAYYPIEILPYWLQCIAQGLSLRYLFEATRSYVLTGDISWKLILLSTGVNIIYAMLALWALQYAFNKSRDRGLARLSGNE